MKIVAREPLHLSRQFICLGPEQRQPSNSSRKCKSIFQDHAKKPEISRLGDCPCPLVCITMSLPICLNTHTWYIGVHDHIMRRSALRNLCSTTTPNNITFRSPCSWLFPIGFALQRFTFYAVLGPPAPDSKQVSFCKFDSMMFQKQSRQSQE